MWASTNVQELIKLGARDAARAFALEALALARADAKTTLLEQNQYLRLVDV